MQPGEQAGEQIEGNREVSRNCKLNESGPLDPTDTPLERLWSRRSRVQVPSLTPQKALLTRSFSGFKEPSEMRKHPVHTPTSRRSSERRLPRLSAGLGLHLEPRVARLPGGNAMGCDLSPQVALPKGRSSEKAVFGQVRHIHLPRLGLERDVAFDDALRAASWPPAAEDREQRETEREEVRTPNEPERASRRRRSRARGRANRSRPVARGS